MKVNRPINVPRPEVDRNGDTRKSDRASTARRPTGTGRSSDETSNADGDRIETDISTAIESAVEQTLAALEARLEDVRERREELLAKANDDESIASAARAFQDLL